MAAPANDPGAAPVRDSKGTEKAGSGTAKAGSGKATADGGAASNAKAQAKPKAAKAGAKPVPKSPARGTKTDPRASGGGRKIILDEEFLVEGKLEKPNAFYILKRSQADYDWARLDAKFLPLVLESVQDPLF